MSEDVKAKLARAHAELQALTDEHVDLDQGMGQDIGLEELDAVRDASHALWAEEPQLHRDMAVTYSVMQVPFEDVVRSPVGPSRQKTRD